MAASSDLYGKCFALRPLKFSSLHDEDLGYCDHITHTIPIIMDKPIYLPHRPLLRQLQDEVHECINNWLKQGAIFPSNSLYASQVVIVHKKTGKGLPMCRLQEAH